MCSFSNQVLLHLVLFQCHESAQTRPATHIEVTLGLFFYSFFIFCFQPKECWECVAGAGNSWRRLSLFSSSRRSLGFICPSVAFKVRTPLISTLAQIFTFMLFRCPITTLSLHFYINWSIEYFWTTNFILICFNFLLSSVSEDFGKGFHKKNLQEDYSFQFSVWVVSWNFVNEVEVNRTLVKTVKKKSTSLGLCTVFRLYSRHVFIYSNFIYVDFNHKI